MTKLLCLPFAGGNAYSFSFLKPHVRNQLEVTGIEYPGHGSRIRQPPLEDLDALADDAFHQCKAFLNGDYLLYGHSMGAWVAYLLATKIAQSPLPAPRHLFLSGHDAFHHHRSQARHLLPKPELLGLIRKMGGTPDEVFASPELLALFLPLFRADFAAMDQFIPCDISPLPCPLTVFYGSDDPLVSTQGMADWRLYTTGPFACECFTGGHFFIYAHAAAIAGLFLAGLSADTLPP